MNIPPRRRKRRSCSSELPILAADARRVTVQGPDGSVVELDWDALRAEAAGSAPFSGLFRDLLVRAEAQRRAA